MQHQGLLNSLGANREQLLRYLRAHSAGDDAEDLLQELWIRISASPPGPIGNPRSYLFRAATNLMIDRRRSETQAHRRETEWSGVTDRLPGTAANDPAPDRQVDSKHRLALVEAALATLPPRAVGIFRDHRIEGRTQRAIAAERGLSASTVESDLRMVYRLLAELKGKIDEE